MTDLFSIDFCLNLEKYRLDFILIFLQFQKRKCKTTPTLALQIYDGQWYAECLNILNYCCKGYKNKKVFY